MIRITKQTDYGIVLLTQMAGGGERRYNAPDLAAEARLPLPMVSKILKLLTREGVLTSHRGVKGGYSLARHPASISMAGIVAALEGPIAITECIDEEGDCAHEALCPVRSNWHRINEAVLVALQGITLAEMAVPMAPLVSLAARSSKLVTLGRGGAATAAAVNAGPQSHQA